MVATFTTGDGTEMLRTFTPLAQDDPDYAKFQSAMRAAVMKTSWPLKHRRRLNFILTQELGLGRAFLLVCLIVRLLFQ